MTSASLDLRPVGDTGMKVSSLGFGLMTFGDGGGDFDAVGANSGADAQRQIDIALDYGVNFFDTSDNYSGGRSEEILGETLGGNRKRVVVATKVFGRTGPGEFDIGLSAKHIIDACDASLRRLKTDYIDLYQAHNFDGLTSQEETLDAFDSLVRTGKVRHIGCSNHYAWQLTAGRCMSALKRLSPYVSQQILYSLLHRDAEWELLPAAISQNVATLVYSPLAQGYLSGKFAIEPEAEGRLTATKRLVKIDDERARRIVGVLQEIAMARPGASVAQAALNWLRARPGVTSVIVGARTSDQLQNNLSAARWSLTSEEVAMLDTASRTPAPYPRTAQKIFHPERNP